MNKIIEAKIKFDEIKGLPIDKQPPALRRFRTSVNGLGLDGFVRLIDQQLALHPIEPLLVTKRIDW